MTSRRTPFDEIEELFDRMSRQFGGDLPRMGEGGGMVPGRRGPAIDVADHPEHFEVTVDLPGYEREDVELRLADRTLQVSAERETGAETEEPTYVRQERRTESVSRSVTLPEAVVADDVEAALTNGVLTVTLPKVVEGDESRTIDIE